MLGPYITVNDTGDCESLPRLVPTRHAAHILLVPVCLMLATSSGSISS